MWATGLAWWWVVAGPRWPASPLPIFLFFLLFFFVEKRREEKKGKRGIKNYNNNFYELPFSKKCSDSQVLVLKFSNFSFGLNLNLNLQSGFN